MRNLIKLGIVGTAAVGALILGSGTAGAAEIEIDFDAPELVSGLPMGDHLANIPGLDQLVGSGSGSIGEDMGIVDASLALHGLNIGVKG